MSAAAGKEWAALVAPSLDVLGVLRCRRVCRAWAAALEAEAAARLRVVYDFADADTRVRACGEGEEATVEGWRIYMSGDKLTFGSKGQKRFGMRGLLSPFIFPRADFLPILFKPGGAGVPPSASTTTTAASSTSTTSSSHHPHPLAPHFSAPAAVRVSLLFRTDSVTDVLLQTLDAIVDGDAVDAAAAGGADDSSDGEAEGAAAAGSEPNNGLGGTGFGVRVKTCGVELLEVKTGGDAHPFWKEDFAEAKAKALAIGERGAGVRVELLYAVETGCVDVKLFAVVDGPEARETGGCGGFLAPSSSSSSRAAVEPFFSWSTVLSRHTALPAFPCLVLYSFGHTVVEDVSVVALLDKADGSLRSYSEMLRAPAKAAGAGAASATKGKAKGKGKGKGPKKGKK